MAAQSELGFAPIRAGEGQQRPPVASSLLIREAGTEVANVRKQIRAKGAWAQMSASNRRLRDALETIGALAGDGHIQGRAGEGARYLRLIYELAAAALITDDQAHRAA